MVVGEYRLYHYDPSFPAAVAAAACFGALTSIHAVYFIARRTWYFAPFTVGGLCETIGYVGRILNSRETPSWTTGPYIMQTLLLLVAPALFAASIYMVLGRLVQLVDGDSRSILRGRWITRTFVVGDVISFLAQAGGGGVLAQADTKDKQALGNWITIAGLAVQIVFFGLFMIVSMIFHIRMSNSPTQRCADLRAPWKRFLVVLYLVSTLIMIRSVFRVVEYVQGTNGALQSKEVWLYVFDGLLMFLVMLVLLLHHPCQLTTRSRKEKHRGRRKKRRHHSRRRHGDARGPY